MTEGQFASAVVRAWRLRKWIEKGGTKKQIAAARRKLRALATRIAHVEPSR
jgi:hypothetical protein